eukprot:10082077-Alexandrium_andersonii.AAC.1
MATRPGHLLPPRGGPSRFPSAGLNARSRKISTPAALPHGPRALGPMRRSPSSEAPPLRAG